LILDYLFPKQELPFGTRWNLAGNLKNSSAPWSDTGLLRWVPWFPGRSVYLHHMVRPDADRDLHDHPGHFVSVILKNSYVERLKDGFKTWRAGDISIREAATLHRICDLPQGTAWTLFFMGKRQRTWGFLVGALWVDHKLYKTLRRDK
jgi:hypothetical protein